MTRNGWRDFPFDVVGAAGLAVAITLGAIGGADALDFALWAFTAAMLSLSAFLRRRS